MKPKKCSSYYAEAHKAPDIASCNYKIIMHNCVAIDVANTQHKQHGVHVH